MNNFVAGGYLHRKSPVDPATTPKFIETFSICRELFADHFDNNFFQNKFCFREDKGQIRKVHFFKKKKEICVFIGGAVKIPLFSLGFQN